MNFHTPTDEEIHTAFEHGERAIQALFHDVATQMAELAQQLAKQGEVLQALQARLAKTSRNSRKPPASDGYRENPSAPPAYASRARSLRVADPAMTARP